MRRVLSGFWLFPLFLMLGLKDNLCAQMTPQRVRIAYASSGINFADLFLAKEKGYFRDEGLEPQLIQMSSNIAITAGLSGELDGRASIASAVRASKPAFTSNGIPSDDEIKEHLANDAQILKLPKPVSPAEIFDFSLQREVLRELAIK